jgi:hypothetical protein
MIRLIAAAGFVVALATSAQAITPAPLPQADGMFTQVRSDGTDSALDATADCNALRNDVALDLCAIADQEIRGAQLAFDSAQDLRWTIAFDLADDRHVGADARGTVARGATSFLAT